MIRSRIAAILGDLSSLARQIAETSKPDVSNGKERMLILERVEHPFTNRAGNVAMSGNRSSKYALCKK